MKQIRRRTSSPVGLVLFLTIVGSSLPSCEQKKQHIAAFVVQSKTSRTTAAGAMIAAFKADQITAEDVINAAHERLTAGEDATDFAGAVLDMLQAVEGQLPQGAEFEIFWMRIGQLACGAAMTANNNRRPDEALSLVFGGPKRWQNDAYWQRSPNHDALASIVLDENGRRAEAIARLRDRADLDGTALDVYKKLTGGGN